MTAKQKPGAAVWATRDRAEACEEKLKTLTAPLGASDLREIAYALDGARAPEMPGLPPGVAKLIGPAETVDAFIRDLKRRGYRIVKS